MRKQSERLEILQGESNETPFYSGIKAATAANRINPLFSKTRNTENHGENSGSHENAPFRPPNAENKLPSGPAAGLGNSAQHCMRPFFLYAVSS